MHIAEKYFELGKNYYPTRATWEMTPRCNARCDYCYLADYRDIPEDNDTAAAFRIIDKLFDSGILFLVLTGGEPFIRKDILSILDYIFLKDFFSLTIYSNGTLISDQHIRFLTDHKDHIQSVQFSVFSHIPEINDAYLGVPGALEKILRNGKALLEAGISVVLAFNLFDFNVRDCEVTRRILVDKGFSVRISFSKLAVDTIHEERVKSEISKEFYNSYLKSIDQSLVKKMQLRLSAQEDHSPTSVDFCVGLFTSIAIDYKGNLIPCVTFRNLNIGSVLGDQSIRDLMLSSHIFQRIRSLKKSDLKACDQCAFIHKCRFCLGMMHTRNRDATQPLAQYCTYLEALESYNAVH
jgi:radical SAM protein with 4Fe4S-binding SPASM domain